MKTTISKSSFMLGVQCKKALHMHYNFPELRTPISPEQQSIIDKGTEIGLLARQLFPNGIDVSEGGTLKGSKVLQATQKALATKQTVFYEPAFQTENGLNCRVDILVKGPRITSLIEVKSSTSIKDVQILDVSFQFFVMKNSGYQGEIKAYLAHINNSYVRGESLEIDKLFIIEDITEAVKVNQSLIEDYSKELLRTLECSDTPQVSIGEECFKPYECPFKAACWKRKQVPAYSVFDIGGIRKSKAAELYKQNIKEPHQVPYGALNENQRVEVEAARDNQAYINHSALADFMTDLSFKAPFYIMDFESMMPGVPLYPGTKPYQHLCFQYCVLQFDGKEYQRKDFLSEHGVDPRRAFIENLLKDTAGKGLVYVYNQAFEITRLKEIAQMYPGLSSAIGKLILRIRDIMIPFRMHQVYFPAQRGRYSIKKILPLMAPGLSYENLDIKNGAEAMRLYESLPKMSEAERESTRNALQDYCYMDVHGLSAIISALRKMCQN